MTIELQDDEVFKAAQLDLLPGHEIVDAWLEIPTKFGPKDPRKILYVMVKTPENKVEKYSINYLKVARRIKKQETLSNSE